MTSLFHALRNQLAVATANVEAIVDGTLEPTEPRMHTILEALEAMDVLIARLQSGEAAEAEQPASRSGG